MNFDSALRLYQFVTLNVIEYLSMSFKCNKLAVNSIENEISTGIAEHCR